MARPTSYTQGMQDKADFYVNNGYIEEDDVVPSRAGLSVYLGVSRETLTNWGKANKEFLGTLDRLSAIQEKVSLNKGLTGDFNSAIVKLLLANHGYSDKQNIDHTTQGDKITPTFNVSTQEAASELGKLYGKGHPSTDSESV
jgi:hypothetical protein